MLCRREPVFTEVGDEVWLKPLKAHCRNNVSMKGMLCHVLDVCRIAALLNHKGGEEEWNVTTSLWRSQRVRCPPGWMADFDVKRRSLRSGGGHVGMR